MSPHFRPHRLIGLSSREWGVVDLLLRVHAAHVPRTRSTHKHSHKHQRARACAALSVDVDSRPDVRGFALGAPCPAKGEGRVTGSDSTDSGQRHRAACEGASACLACGAWSRGGGTSPEWQGAQGTLVEARVGGDGQAPGLRRCHEVEVPFQLCQGRSSWSPESGCHS